MRGKDAILLKDLSRELMAHSEYEPIVPPRSSSKSRYVLFVAHICGTLCYNLAVHNYISHFSSTSHIYKA